jgi:two-component system cell cycle sensor histidine kinase/response regulator CckA
MSGSSAVWSGQAGGRLHFPDPVILVVEDDPSVSELLHDVLAPEGYTVVTAADGMAGLARIEAGGIDLVLLLTDVVMPGIGGQAVARLFARVHPETKVLYMSGYTDAAVARHGMLEEGVALLQKPFTPTILARKVRQVLDAPR